MNKEDDLPADVETTRFRLYVYGLGGGAKEGSSEGGRDGGTSLTCPLR